MEMTLPGIGAMIEPFESEPLPPCDTSASTATVAISRTCSTSTFIWRGWWSDGGALVERPLHLDREELTVDV